MSAVCTSELHASGRRLYCSDRCRQSATTGATRLRSSPLACRLVGPAAPSRFTFAPLATPACNGARTATFSARQWASGASAPACEEPVAYQELTQLDQSNKGSRYSIMKHLSTVMNSFGI